MTKDYIFIQNINVYAFHGINEDEKINGQEFYIDLRLYQSLHEAGITDDLRYSTNYADVAMLANTYLSTNRFDLIEKAAEGLAIEILNHFSLLDSVEVTIHKPEAPIPIHFENVGVTIKREVVKAYLSVGSNMGDKYQYIKDAIDILKNTAGIREVKESSLTVTKPYGGVIQDDFVNGAIELKTYLTPFELLDVINNIEAQCGRVREVHWGPRTLDLDILFYGDEIIDTDRLRIPHIDMQNRMFVLEPLMELCPYKINPVWNKSVICMYEECKKNDLGEMLTDN